MPQTIDRSMAFAASRYGKSLDGTGRLPELPVRSGPVRGFVDALLAAESGGGAHPGRPDVPFFEACLPIEEIARRGRDTLRFGPMKPMGLADPATGRRP